nr:MAG TPA: hypothetical protein [Caudoviricetes sp.]
MTHFIPFWWALCPKCFYMQTAGAALRPGCNCQNKVIKFTFL